jgi:hypothetical protein
MAAVEGHAPGAIGWSGRSCSQADGSASRRLPGGDTALFEVVVRTTCNEAKHCAVGSDDVKKKEMMDEGYWMFRCWIGDVFRAHLEAV